MKTKHLLWPYEAPETEEIEISIEDDLLGASINGGKPPVPDAGDGEEMGDDFWD